MPTGECSGYFVVDVDRLKALEELPHELPETLMVRTRSGGRHFYFNYVQGINNSPGGLPEGIDVRGEGGYVIVPDSPGYEVVNCADVADAPAWLLEIIRETKGKRNNITVGSPDGTARIDLKNIEPIADGGRNNTLTRYGGALRARGLEHDEIEAALLKINAERCTPPLPEREVRQTAWSVSRYERGKAPATPEVMEVLDTVEHAMWAEEDLFKGNAGKTNWNFAVTLLKKARAHGQDHVDGVKVSIDVRSWASESGSSSTTTGRAVEKRLTEAGWIRRATKGAPGVAGAIVILKPKTEARETDTFNQGSYLGEETGSLVSIPRAPFSTPRLRRSSLGHKPKLGLVEGTRKVRSGARPNGRPAQRRIGPGCNGVIDYLEKVGGSAALEDISEAVGVGRARDLVRRKTAHPKSRDGYVTRLENAGVVAVVGDEVRLVAEWLEALNEERRKAGEIEAERLDKYAHKQAQESEWYQRKRKPDAAPTDNELAARREPFKEALERQKRVEFLRKRGLALEAMQAHQSGAQLNLQRLMDGDMQNVGYLVKSVLAWHRIPSQQWEFIAEEWREAVLSAANLLAREYAHEEDAA